MSPKGPVRPSLSLPTLENLRSHRAREGVDHLFTPTGRFKTSPASPPLAKVMTRVMPVALPAQTLLTMPCKSFPRRVRRRASRSRGRPRSKGVLFGRLDRDRPQCRALLCFRYRLRITCVRFAAHKSWIGIFRLDWSDIIPHCSQFPGPLMRSKACCFAQ